MPSARRPHPDGADARPLLWHLPLPSGAAMRAIDEAERFVKLSKGVPMTAARQDEADKLLKALAAAPWDDASPEEREAGWALILRLTLLTQDPSPPADRRAG